MRSVVTKMVTRLEAAPGYVNDLGIDPCRLLRNRHSAADAHAGIGRSVRLESVDRNVNGADYDQMTC